VGAQAQQGFNTLLGEPVNQIPIRLCADSFAGLVRRAPALRLPSMALLLGVGFLGFFSPVASAQAASGSALTAGQTLTAGEYLESPDHHFQLVMQGDGNLVEYVGSRALWSTGTSGNPGSYLVNQTSDGNLVLYSAAGRALWVATGAYGNPGDSLVLQADANLVVYNTASQLIWINGAGNPVLTYTGPTQVTSSTTFTPTATVSSPAASCQSGATVTFTLSIDPLTGSPGPYVVESAVSVASGAVTGASVSTTGWLTTRYAVTISYTGTAVCAGGSSKGTLDVRTTGGLEFGQVFSNPSGGSAPANYVDTYPNNSILYLGGAPFGGVASDVVPDQPLPSGWVLTSVSRSGTGSDPETLEELNGAPAGTTVQIITGCPYDPEIFPAIEGYAAPAGWRVIATNTGTYPDCTYETIEAP